MEYSDRELAYHLQLDEAIAASLYLHPSSPFVSGSTSFSVAPSSHLNVPAALEGNHGWAYNRPAVVRGKFENDRRDREPREAEATRVMSEFSRMIHGQTSANSGSPMPIEKSVEFIDRFQVPYAEASSSSAARPLPTDKTYRLYFKGVLSNGLLGSEVSLCGIGVAICDSRDDLIFELKKPVRGNVNSAAADLKALLEGLTTAFSLGIKCLNFFCDTRTVFQYFKRRWNPKHHNLTTLVDKVIDVQRKFVYCHPNLLLRGDKINYALKLGRNAVISEVDKVRLFNNHSGLQDCVICLEETNMDQMFYVSRCFHSYCFSCMRRHVEAKLLHGIIPKCPHEGCTSGLSIKSCKEFLTPEIIEMMKQRLKEASTAPTKKVYCPFPRCSELMSKRQASRFAEKEAVQFRKSGERKCVKCHGYFCINCETPWHNEMSCTKYKRLNPSPAEDTKLKALASKEFWRQCGKCKLMIELTEGCYHMTCRCGYEFCYTCGAEYKNEGKVKKQTCSCPLFDDDEDDDDDDDDDDEDYETYSDDDYEDFYHDGN